MNEDSRYPSEEAERFQIRLPDGFRDQIRIAAEANHRSMNAEIIARLMSTFHSSEEDSSMKTGRDSDQFRVRFPDGMRDRIKARAESSGRTMQAEIVVMLEAVLSGAAREDERLSRIEAKLDKLLAA
jgi:plasmid stability protein